MIVNVNGNYKDGILVPLKIPKTDLKKCKNYLKNSKNVFKIYLK